MWIEDLAPLGDSARVLAVGWLERGRPYPTGDVAPGVFAKLRDLLVDLWQPATTGGSHDCDLCFHEPEKRGTRNLFVPGSGRLYVAPELILHYVNAHGYAPPAEFCHAVLACPPTRSPEYRRALTAAAGPGFLASVAAL